MLKIQFAFYAQDGSCVQAVTVGEAMDSGDKSSHKAMAAAFKYACIQVFCIPTEEFETVKYNCTDCGKPFSSFEDKKTGLVLNAGQAYTLSQRANADGKARCRACRQKEENRRAESEHSA